MRVQYITDDGRIFDNEEDCLDYERSLAEIEYIANTAFYDEKGCAISKKGKTLEGLIEESSFIRCFQHKRLKAFIEYANKEYGFYIDRGTITEGTTYLYYNYKQHIWADVASYISVVKEQYNSLVNMGLV